MQYERWPPPAPVPPLSLLLSGCLFWPESDDPDFGDLSDLGEGTGTLGEQGRATFVLRGTYQCMPMIFHACELDRAVMVGASMGVVTRLFDSRDDPDRQLSLRSSDPTVLEVVTTKPDPDEASRYFSEIRGVAEGDVTLLVELPDGAVIDHVPLRIREPASLVLRIWDSMPGSILLVSGGDLTLDNGHYKLQAVPRDASGDPLYPGDAVSYEVLHGPQVLSEYPYLDVASIAGAAGDTSQMRVTAGEVEHELVVTFK
ncbi:MAG: hypothetical protein JRI68_29160 [Deltaproteobacteria bacterium]|nr:hypothetical protein [Deltaproteobacteria bacterium]